MDREKVVDKSDEILTHIIDIKTQIAVNQTQIQDVKESLKDCPVWEIERRVTKIESDSGWVSRITGVIGGIFGALGVIVTEWFLHKGK